MIRGVTLLHKGNHIERPLSLVCPLEIKGLVATEDGTLQLTQGFKGLKDLGVEDKLLRPLRRKYD